MVLTSRRHNQTDRPRSKLDELIKKPIKLPPVCLITTVDKFNIWELINHWFLLLLIRIQEILIHSVYFCSGDWFFIRLYSNFHRLSYFPQIFFSFLSLIRYYLYQHQAMQIAILIFQLLIHAFYLNRPVEILNISNNTCKIEKTITIWVYLFY